MTTSCVLVRVPGTPFSINDLRPDTRLATLAGSLIDSGHHTCVLDYGTVEIFERLYPSGLRAVAIRHAESRREKNGDYGYDIESGPFGNFPEAKAIVEHHKDVWERVGEKIAARRDFDFVLFALTHPKDLKTARVCAKRLRALIPGIRLFGWGLAFSNNHDLVTKSLRTFDAVFLGTGCRSVARLAELLKDSKAWKDVPDLAYADGVRLNLTPPAPAEDGAAAAVPSFETEIYPAIGEQTKLELFDIEEVMKPGESGPNAANNEGIRRPTEAILKDIRALRRLYSAHAFHFSGCLPQSDHAQVLGRELLAKKLKIRYSRDAHISSTPAHAVAEMSASGCRALDFRIDTGSQRLLDRYYGHPFCVTQIERVLRRCGISDLFACTRYTYPTPEDDYHTLAETLRLIARSKPDAVILDLPRRPGAANQRGRLFHEFRPFVKNSDKRIAAANRAARAEVEELGVELDISARFAFLAELAGHQGRETEFKAQLTLQLLTGDTFGLASTVERVNDKARAPEMAFFIKPFTPSYNAVAN